MRHISKLVIVIAALGLLNCNTKKEKESNASEIAVELMESTSVASKDWISQRVKNAQERLATTKAGQILWKAIEQHGGLLRWYANGSIHFRFNYKNLKTGGPDTYQTIDTWSSKARHQLVSDTTIEYGWDGEKAWKYPHDAEVKENPRFWALTPFYFVGVPFVVTDKGITLEYQGEISFEENNYHQVRVNFASEVGDSPDDFYVLYIDTNTYRIGGLRYIVSYPGFYEKGQHGAEKHMTYYGEQTIDGIVFPQSIKTYVWDGSAPQEHTTTILISDLEFRPDTPPSYFDVPEGSRVMEGYSFD